MKKTRFTALFLILLLVISAIATAEEDQSNWLSDELVEIHIMREDNVTKPMSNDAYKWGYIERLLNVRVILETPPKADYADKVQTLIATNDMPDIMHINSSYVNRWARDGVFVNLSEHEDEMPNMFAVLDSDPRYRMLTVDGDFYGAPVIQLMCPEARPSGQLVNIRTDLLEKYDIEAPTTWDELIDVILFVQENEPGMVGITNRKGGSTTATRKVLDCMAYPLGSGSDMYYDADLGGVWIYGPAHENFKEVLSYLNKCYEVGVLDPDYATMTKDLWVEKLSSGTAICTVENDGVVRGYNTALQTVDPSFKLEVIPTLTNSLGQTRNFMYDNDWLTEAYVISADSKNVDVCIKFLDWCYSEQGATVNAFGEEGVTFDYVDGRATIKDELLAKYAELSDPSTELCVDLGIGLLDITPYVDIGAQEQMSLYMMDEAERLNFKAQVASIANDAGLRNPSIAPPMTEEQTSRYNELHVAVENIIYQAVDKFITGEEPIANYDAVIAAAREAGATEMEEIYNQAWQAMLGD